MRLVGTMRVTTAHPVPVHVNPLFAALMETVTVPAGGVVGALYVAPIRLLPVSDPQLPEGVQERDQFVVLPQLDPVSVAEMLSVWVVCKVFVDGESAMVQVACALGKNSNAAAARSSFFMMISFVTQMERGPSGGENREYDPSL